MATIELPIEHAIGRFEERHGVDLVRKDRDALSRVIGWVWPRFLTYWWTVIRLPWWHRPRILYPSTLDSPFRQPVALQHELVHVPQVQGWRLLWSALLLFLLPLPVLFSGRWFLERRPFLVHLRNGVPIDEVVNLLWWSYLFPWPRWLMRRWFERELARES